MPFRSKTTQILGSVLQSPIPSLIPFFRTPGLETVSEIVLKSSSYFDNITRFLDRSRQLVVFLNASDQIGHYLGSQMSERSDEEEAQIELDVLVQHTAPVLDRLGRLLTDLSLVISKNNNIEASLIETSEDLHINRFVIENTE